MNALRVLGKRNYKENTPPTYKLLDTNQGD